MRLMKYLRSRSGVPIISGVLSVGFLLMMNAVSFAAEATPNTYEVTCYKTEISTDGITWVTCFDNPAGTLVDLASPTGPGTLFGQGDVPEGTYKHIRITIMNTITYSCTSPVIAATGFRPYLPAADAHVPVYFSIDGGSSWSNDGSELVRAFLLPDSIKVEYNTPTKVLLNFIITNSLNDNSGSWTLEPPTMNVSSVVIKTLDVTFTGGDYYFDRSNITIDIPVTNTIITPTWMRFQSGWGKITFTNPVSNEGAFTVTAGADNTENSQEINNGGGSMSGTIQTPQIYMNSTDMTGTYFIDPSGYMNMVMPESGIIRGAVSDDGRVFIAIETESPNSCHMIYAVKAEAQLSRDLSGKFIFCMYGTRLTTAVDATDTPYPQGYRLNYTVEIGMVDIDPLSNTGLGALSPSGVGNRVDVDRPLSNTQVTSLPTLEASSNTDVAKLTTDNAGGGMGTGIWALNTGDSGMRGYMLSDNSVSLLCGSTINNTSIYTNTGITYTTNVMQFGVCLNPITTGTPALSDVNGDYTFVYRGDYLDTGYGITKTNFSVTLGRFNFNGAGAVTGTMTRSERGVVSTEEMTGLYDVADVTIGSGTASMTVKAIRLYQSIGKIAPENGPHIILTPDKKVGLIYMPVTVWKNANGSENLPRDVESINQERGLGFAVKTK
ncbi:MAG: hypothetical protein AAB038_04835 [Planctomycetota bacterium]